MDCHPLMPRSGRRESTASSPRFIPIMVNALQSMSHEPQYSCVRNACGRQGTPVPVIWRHARSYFAHRPLPSRAFLYQR
jgi:hypothetical protein